MPKTIAVVDYGAGNLRSIQKALVRVGAEGAAPGLADGACGDAAESSLRVVITGDAAVVDAAAAVVLPGVGAAGATMRHLGRQGLVPAVRRAALSGRPFLGVCLGLQLLFAHHEEDDVPGLGVLPGRVRRLPGGIKVPHMGWNTVQITGQAGLAPEAEPAPYFYFVHSYYAEPAAEVVPAVAGTTRYGLEFCSLLVRDALWATQFHPEKSGANGLRLLRAFVGQVVA
jgi:glutamine amidotransferase